MCPCISMFVLLLLDSSHWSACGPSLCQESRGHRLAGRVSCPSPADPWCGRRRRAAEVAAVERWDGRIIRVWREEVPCVEEAVWTWSSTKFGRRLLYVRWRRWPTPCSHAGSRTIIVSVISIRRNYTHFSGETTTLITTKILIIHNWKNNTYWLRSDVRRTSCSRLVDCLQLDGARDPEITSGDFWVTS